MRWTETFIPTLRETPAEADTPSHALLLRAGFIQMLSSGFYSYLPLGFRTLNKIIAIVREEMDAAGASEVLMPAVHPEELWKEGPRFEGIRDIVFSFTDRNERRLLLGPTHEEVVTDMVRRHLNSYKQLPFTLYQIQTKFRDEPRPRGGILRSREFIMKDAYSFDVDTEGMERSYERMYEAYRRIFDRCGLEYVIVEADTGAMGGDVSHEFMVPCEQGEDVFVSCDGCDYAANVEKAQPAPVKPSSPEPPAPMEKVETPGVKTIEEVGGFLGVPPHKMLKTLVYITDDGEPVAVLVRGDHELNEVKLARYLGCGVRMADAETIRKVTGGPVGFSGPVGLEEVRIIADRDALGPNMVTGANEEDYHLVNVNEGRDFSVPERVPLRTAQEGDRCERCGGSLKMSKSIEIGHVFKLGLKYSEAMGAKFLDASGKERAAVMGCYGIGINRIMASAVELYHDEKGIRWPIAIAPYSVLVLPVDYSDEQIRTAADGVYARLKEKGVDVLLDDRDQRAGVKFNDADLVGIPLRVTIGKRSLQEGKVELTTRANGESRRVPLENAVESVEAILADMPPHP